MAIYNTAPFGAKRRGELIPVSNDRGELIIHPFAVLATNNPELKENDKVYFNEISARDLLVDIVIKEGAEQIPDNIANLFISLWDNESNISIGDFLVIKLNEIDSTCGYMNYIYKLLSLEGLTIVAQRGIVKLTADSVNVDDISDTSTTAQDVIDNVRRLKKVVEDNLMLLTDNNTLGINYDTTITDVLTNLINGINPGAEGDTLAEALAKLVANIATLKGTADYIFAKDGTFVLIMKHTMEEILNWRYVRIGFVIGSAQLRDLIGYVSVVEQKPSDNIRDRMLSGENAT
jgi:hypothetical protein